ncbi:hypothetical protein JQK62_26550 [Leptospira santarosai]|nr:hypothetical protein [Leptospira santarosai]
MELLNTVFEVFMRTYPGFLEAALMTLKITAVALVLGTILGLVFALMKISRSKNFKGTYR